MAKKLNKKVAVIGVILLILVVGGGMSLLIGPKVARRFGLFQNPDKSLAKARQLLEAGDYENAEKEFGMAYSYGKTDEYKIERLFELAQFHLINNDQHEAEWNKAMGCWNKIVTIDGRNIQARQALLDFYYQAADAGDARAWISVNENTTELLDVLQDQGVEPDTFLLTAHAKSLLSIAQRGETTNRKDMLDESIKILSELLEKEARNEELYKLMADAVVVEGRLDALAGRPDAAEQAQDKALDLLETAVEQSDDKAMAVADLILFKMQTTPNDPNALEAIRTEIEERSRQVQPNDKLWFVTSIAYETPGDMSAEAELNRAIEAIRQAHELKPENFEYIFRMSRLMYRKGNAFNDPAAVEDALQIAEGALLLQEVQDIPGPLQGRNLRYRFTLNNYLADLYLEKAIAAKEAGEDADLGVYIQKAEERVEEILSTLGGTDNPTAQKFQGMLALAKGQRDEAVRLLYKAYTQNKALDVSNELSNVSNVDSRVCVILARIAEQNGQLGLQAEFLQGAFMSRDRYIQQKPRLLLDYAELINRLRSSPGWENYILQLVDRYQTLYGANQQSRKLAIEASIALGQLDEAKELLTHFDDAPEVKLNYELRVVLYQIAQLQQTIAVLEEEKKKPTAEQTRELETLRADRDGLLEQLLNRYPEELNSQLLSSICGDLVRNDKAAQAVQYLDTYLASNPDALGLMVLRLQAQQEDPMNLTPEQRLTLRDQAIESISDAKQKAILISERYRSEGEYEKALKSLEENSQIDINDSDIIQRRFDITLEQKDVQAAEALQQIIRRKNLDSCEGNLAAARLEMVKENYALALRRLDECLEMRPFSSYTYYLKSLVQRRLEDEEGSIESATMAIRMTPRNPVYMRHLASLLFERNTALGSKVTVEQQKEAEQAILVASQLNPTDTQLQSIYSEVIQDNDPDRALDIRQRLLKNDPTAVNALMLGNMALRMAQAEWDPVKKSGLIELAGKAYQQGIEIDPENEILRQTYADYQQRTGKGEAAIELLKGDKNLEWKFYLRNGQFEKAETILKELLQEKLDDQTLIQGLVLVSEGAGKRDEIKRYLDMFTELDQTKEIELWVLQKYIDNGFTVEAEKKLASFSERYPDEKSSLLIEAWTKMAKGQLEEALTLNNRYLETDTSNPGAWRLRGRLYRLMNQPRKAIDDLQRAKSLKDMPEVRMELATVYVEMDQMTAAIGELVSSLKDPQTPQRLRLMLETLYQKNNRTSDLEKFYALMIEKYPESPFWYLRPGVYYLRGKDFSRAQGLLKKAFDLSLVDDQPNPTVLQYYLESLYQSQQYEQTIALASKYVDGPSAHIAYGYIAQVQVRLNQPEKAIESFYKALDKAGTNMSVLESVARIMMQTVGEKAVVGWIDNKLAADEASLPAHLLASSLAQMNSSYNKAIAEVEQCIDKVAPDSQEWLVYTLKKVNLLIMAYTKTVDEDYMSQAVELLTEILQLQPNNPSLLNNLAYLLADNDQQLEAALQYARKAHQRDPGNPIYLDTYAYAQCKTGRYTQAEQNLIRAIQIYEASGQPIPWDVYKHLGMAKEGLGKVAEAIEMYQKAQDASEQIPEKEKQKLQQAVQRLQQS